ncbi:PPE family protein [Mycobacterium lepromatosis]|nr:PPE family protein [Mycobacterium lepromatosis]UKN41836.1 PPE family protein [Mycobacterium lepromatosis]
MTNPWMAFPPEVQSAMLNFGAGIGPMLSSASYNLWLSAEYRWAASEIEALLGEVRSGGWQGQAVETFVGACMPFLAWLMKAAAGYMEVASQQEVVAAAYVAAVEAMPTQLELTANRVVRGVLMATNFFGINTIPIALNEEEYVQMWVRAATTMATYSAISHSALASMPQTTSPPPILKSDALVDDVEEDSRNDGHSNSSHASAIDRVFADILRNVSGGRLVWDPLNGTLNGLDYDDYVYPGQPIWWLARGLEFFQDGEQFWELLFTNPTAAFQFLLYIVLFDWPTHIAQLGTWLAENPQLLLAALGGTIANLGAVIGLAGLSGLSAVPSAAIPTVVSELAPIAAAPAMAATAGAAPAVAAIAPLTASGAPASLTASGAPATAGAPLGPATGFGGFPPYLVDGRGPGIGFGSGQSAYAKVSGSVSDSAAVAEATTQASAREQVRARRRRSVAQERGHREECVTMDTGFDAAVPSSEGQPGTRVSDRGVGCFGFSGTVRKEAVVEVAGLTTLAGDDFGGGPTMPMVPGTWAPAREPSTRHCDTDR